MSQDEVGVGDRIRRLEDRAELGELVARYAVAVDDKDYATLHELFAKEGEFVGLVGPIRSGRDGVVEYLKERAASPSAGRLHTPTAQYLDHLTDSSARGVVICYAALFSDDGSLNFFAFRYDDEYTREDGRWRFARRRVHRITNLIPPKIPSD